MAVPLKVVTLLIVSNTFMTIAWYGHLKHRQAAILTTVVVSWLIALPEYSFQVPANRLGYGYFTATQLKVLQEAISLTVFAVFAFLYLGERPTWRSLLAFVLVLAAVALVTYRPDQTKPGGRTPPADGDGGQQVPLRA